MQNLAPSGALARRSQQWLQLAFLIGTGGAFIAVIGLALIVIPFAEESNPVFSVYSFVRTVLFLGGALMALGGLGLAVRAYLTRIDNDQALVTGQRLSLQLDQRFTFVRNISKRGLGYIDAVLVGPPGALVFRVVDKTGAFTNERGDWVVRNKSGQWVPASLNPTEEAIVDVKALRSYLGQNNLPNMPVFGVVVFTHEEPVAQITTHDPVLPVAHLSNLIEQLQGNYLSGDRIDQATIRRIVDLIYEN